LQGCEEQYQKFNVCLQTEKNRIKRREQELLNKILGIKEEEKPLVIETKVK
jgi:hypothetical protein